MNRIRAFLLTLGLLATSINTPLLAGDVHPPEPETGDLESIIERGYIRLLEPQFASDTSLPRGLTSLSQYREEAEAFAESLGLQAQWIYVENNVDLVPHLERGVADIIATPFVYTRERAEKVAFTRAFSLFKERLVYSEREEIPDLKDGEFILGVPDGSAHLATANELARLNADITVRILPDTTHAAERLSQIQKGQYDVTLISEDLANVLLKETKGLASLELDNSREVAWAVRRDNPELQMRLNEFLTKLHITANHNPAIKRNWQAIQKAKTLRVITMNSPTSYFMWRNELAGFDYGLMKHFAKQHELRLKVLVYDSPETMIRALHAGEGDVIAASLTDTPERRINGLMFSQPYLKVREQLVGRRENLADIHPEQPHHLRVHVNPNASFINSLSQIKWRGTNLEIIPRSGLKAGDFIHGVLTGEYDYTVADSHLVAMESTWNDELVHLFDISEERPIAWAMREEQTALKSRLDDFIEEEYRSEFYNILYKRYFVEKKSIQKRFDERLLPDGSLSPYDDLIQEYALQYNLDWRLLAAQIYQESRFNPKARSAANAKGLMQLLPRTAKSMGYTDLYDPETSIRAGTKYMNWLRERFPEDLNPDEQIFFTLAAYNAGHGHVNDARTLARRLGKNPDQWFESVEKAMLLLSKKKYYSNARYGYVRGREPVNYVRSIRDRYLAYANISKPSRIQLLSIQTNDGDKSIHSGE